MSLELDEYKSAQQRKKETHREIFELLFKIKAAQESFSELGMPKVLQRLVWDYFAFSQDEWNDAMLIGIANSLRQENGVAGKALFEHSVQDARRLSFVDQPNDDLIEWSAGDAKEAQQQVVQVERGPGFFDRRLFRNISEKRQNLLGFDINNKNCSTLADLQYEEFQAAFRAWKDKENDYTVPVVFALLMGVPGAFMLPLGLAGIGDTKGLIAGGGVLLFFAVAILFVAALLWSDDRAVRQRFEEGDAYIKLYLDLRLKMNNIGATPTGEVDEDHLLTEPTATTPSLPVAASSRFLAAPTATTPRTPLLTRGLRGHTAGSPSYASTDSEGSSSDEEQERRRESISDFRLG